MSDDAAYAVNWRTVLLADAALGVVLLAAGIAVLVLWSGWGLPVGAFVAAAGLTYLWAVLRRARRWAGLRREAGLA